jgi:hypothetical protein
MMRCVLLGLFSIAICLAIQTNTPAQGPAILPQDLLDAGWIELFDGETLFGWKPVGDAQWKVADDTITTSGEKLGWLMTTTEWGDFELHVEFKASPSTNSGIFFRSALEPTDPTKDCYELNIAPPENRYPTGTLVGREKVAVTTESKDGGWHTFDVLAHGGNISVRYDNDLVVEYKDPSPIRIGHIGLQAKEDEVAFRNVRLRPLGLKPLLNGTDLSGWTTAGAEQSEFDVTEVGELRLKNGPGQIATDDEFRDFVLQLQCKVNGDGLNSGVFFRTLREGRWMGYESQINNVVQDGDRTKPADFGTGAIYRRQPARRVVPEDHQWFTKTIVADGPHFAVWVNGYQATDWTDTRPEKENPREGLRLGPGVIAIQGHDPTTDFLFRKIGIAELPE